MKLNGGIEMKVWARLGTIINVDEKEFAKDQIKAIINAIKRGDYEFSGDSYVPSGCVGDDEESEEISFDL